MIEPIMFFGIGFLVAGLLGLIIVPLVHNRAVRLTARRLEASTPLSMAEIQADKDQLRAEFAMSTRRLEMSVDQMKARTGTQLADLGKKTDAINRLRTDLTEKTASIASLESREKTLQDQLRVTEEEFAAKTLAMQDAERALADKKAALTKLTSELDDRSVTADSQRIEIVALRTQVEALRNRLGDTEREVNETEGRLTRERQATKTAGQELEEARAKLADLGGRITELEKQLVTQTAEAQALSKRGLELEAQLSDQSRLLAERGYECERLKTDITVAQKVAEDLRAELGDKSSRARAASESLRSEKATLEGQLAQAKDEQTKLKNEIANMRREAEATWASERVENALLRERINDIAAEIARLTMTLEGPNSPIESILAQHATPTNGAAKGGSAPGAQGGSQGAAPEAGGLADRIRALQARSSRAVAAT
jgi:chromosome segregation ATPase